MIHCEREPSSTTVTERRTEIAEILASGYLRLQMATALATRYRCARTGCLAGDEQTSEDEGECF